MTVLDPPTRVNHVSETVSTVQGHGVHTAFCDLVAAHTDLGLEVGVNEDWRDGVLHVHTLGPASLRRLVRHRGLRVVSAHVTPGSLRGSLVGVQLYAPAFAAYVRAFYNAAHVVIAVSAAAADELRALGVRTPVEVVPNAVGAEPFLSTPARRAAARADLGFGDAFTVLGVGQLQPRKGIEEFAQCARAMPDARFVWVGARQFGALSAGRAEMGHLETSAPSNLHFTGQLPRSGVAAHCRGADAFLFPSRHETFGMAPVEAAFAGLPLVLSDLPVFSEVFGSSQAYLRAGDVPGYVAHLRALQTDPELRQRLGARAAAAVARYEGLQVADRIAGLYRTWSAHRVGTGTTAPLSTV
ncbi:glycosyltransferase family 4 protein [Cellulomonas phragmiteti]|uniref:D-inositol 3-phosphate glycosyltransferase n=1 Tax=Cellulomonas phragmiteti TaxID=478780 RepID=A0ABQ4DII8_9CELL|nr:glycosyltransferase [Cellulomonas phragmiteti]GIG39166.1 glycosyl transferase [Cellulomonas phragmiteti]